MIMLVTSYIITIYVLLLHLTKYNINFRKEIHFMKDTKNFYIVLCHEPQANDIIVM